MELDQAAVERVLRRASDLSAGHPEPGAIPAGTTDEVLIAAAGEVGIEPAAVKMSLAIERLGPPPTPTHYDWLVGPGWVVGQRTIPAGIDITLGRLDDLLRKQHGLRRIRSQGHRGEWARRDGSLAGAVRLVKQMSGEQGVSDADSVVADAREADADRTVLRVALDRRSQRAGRFTGGAVVTTLGATGLAIVTAAISPLVLIASPVVLIAGVGTMRRGVRQAEHAGRELERVLDAVETGSRSAAR